MTTSNTLASAGTADLHAASVARIFGGIGPRIALAPDGIGSAPVSDDHMLDDMSDAELGLDAEPEEREASSGAVPPKPAAELNEDGLTPEDLADDEKPEDEDDATKADAGSLDDGVKVKLDDGQELPLGELKKGYLRQADYTRKTQDIARERTDVTKAAERLIAFDQQSKQALQIAAKVIGDYIPAAPDMSLLQSNPAEYTMRKELRERGLAQIAELQQAFQQQQKGSTGLSDADRQSLVAREITALVEKAPDFRDPTKRQAILSDITTRAQSEYGFSADDLAGVTDHRAILALKDALAYRKLLAGKTAAITKVQATAPMRSATRQAPQQRVHAGQAQNFERARRTGSEEDVARLLTDADLGGGF